MFCQNRENVHSVAQQIGQLVENEKHHAKKQESNRDNFPSFCSIIRLGKKGFHQTQRVKIVFWLSDWEMPITWSILQRKVGIRFEPLSITFPVSYEKDYEIFPEFSLRTGNYSKNVCNALKNILQQHIAYKYQSMKAPSRGVRTWSNYVFISCLHWQMSL